MKMMTTIVLIIITIYLLICFVLYFLQEKLIFFPPVAQESTYQKYKNNEIFYLKNKQKTLGWKINNSEGFDKTILYFGGNAEDVIYFNEEAKQYRVKQLITFNYPGYGKSIGTPSQENLYKSALNSYDWIIKKYGLNSQDIIVVGRSLGSSVATYLAANRNVSGLILITPFDSIKSIAQKNYKFVPVSLLMKHPFPTVEYIKKVKIPVLILAAQKDELIPSENLKKLMKQTNNNTKLIEYKNSGHNTIQNDLNYYVDINRFIKSIIDQ